MNSLTKNAFLTAMDYPDPDVIRVNDTYYMVSTSMYFMPGCEILRSYDLVHWEYAACVYETLDDTPAQKLEGERHIYGKGMWAASFRYHKGLFYICFAANDTQRTYLYTSPDIEGPWKKQLIKGLYHDNSLLFDDDGRVYIVYGNTDIYLTELREDLTAPKENGFHKCILSDQRDMPLGYEGCHLYKINGKYVLMTCHMPMQNAARKVQSCFVADRLDGQWQGGIVISDDRGFRNFGVAQGGLVDTPEGDWYSVLFQDMGAVGRIPVLCPVRWENGFPIFGNFGLVPAVAVGTGARPDYVYAPLFGSDDFCDTPDAGGKITLRHSWQWNHNPQHALWSVTQRPGALRIRTEKRCVSLTQAVNTLTQRMHFPVSQASVLLDGNGLNNGDFICFSVLQSCYRAIAVQKENGNYFLCLLLKEAKDERIFGDGIENCPGTVAAKIPLHNPAVRVGITAEFGAWEDWAWFWYEENQVWKQLGERQKLYFKLDHFTGCRYALSVFSTEETGGYGDFLAFAYEK